MPRPNRGYQLTYGTPKGYQARQWYIFWYDKGVRREFVPRPQITDSGALEDAESARAAFVAGRTRPSGPSAPERLTIRQALDYYGAEHGPQTADPARIGYAIDALLTWWADSPVSAVTGNTCRAYLKSRKTKATKTTPSRAVAPATVRRELATLNAALEHCRREGYLTAAPGVWLPDKKPGRDRWLTRSEAAGLLRAARAQPKARAHLPTFILLALYSGHRAEAVLALQWRKNIAGGWVDLERGLIDFNPQGRAQTKKRRGIIPIPRKLLLHLRQVRARTVNYVIESDGQRVKNVRRSFATACRRAGLTDVVRHTLRHTACTWMMQAGVDPRIAAGWVRMSMETFDRVYAHHHPNYLGEAKAAWDVARGPPRNEDNSVQTNVNRHGKKRERNAKTS